MVQTCESYDAFQLFSSNTLHTGSMCYYWNPNTRQCNTVYNKIRQYILKNIHTTVLWRFGLVWFVLFNDIIACELSDYRHIVHNDGFVWLIFVHERFSTSEQTLNSQKNGVHYMSVITRLTCNNFILLMRNSPVWQTYRDDTADDTLLCISGIVLGMTGLRLWLACVHKGNIRTS